MIDQNKLYGLALTLIVLLSALAGRIPSGSSDEVIYSDRPVEATSVTADGSASLTISASLAASAQENIFPPKISASSALVKYLNSSEALFSFQPNQQWPVASLTKLMTAVTAAEKISEASNIKISQNAVATEGDAGNLITGKAYPRDFLIRLLLKVSSNDAAEALAEYVGRDEFIQQMNEKAISIGMYNTRFFDPHGLSALNQSMTSDLQKLVNYIFNKRPELFAITREPEGNIHPFVNRDNFIGGKTGFIDEASGNLISLFNYRGRPLLIIVLGSEDRAQDTQILYDRFTSR